MSAHFLNRNSREIGDRIPIYPEIRRQNNYFVCELAPLRTLISGTFVKLTEGESPV